MSPEELEAAGWKEYPVRRDFDLCDRNWQYRARGPGGTRFFVQVRLWRHSKHRPDLADGWDAYAQFRGQDDRTFDVSLLSAREMTPAELVAWFETAWRRLSCRWYEREPDPNETREEG